jgi:tRNA (guanosine-2'-O-)-methyltransferase
MDLEEMLSAERVRRLDAVLAARTWHTVLVLDNIHDSHNASACLRSADAFGIQEVYAVEPVHPLRPSGAITMGCERWLTIHHVPTAEACVAALRARGYRIWISDLAGKTPGLAAIDFAHPAALVFGNEKDGISPALRDAAAGRFRIPMAGFSQSLNISVAAAITLHHAYARRPAHDMPGEEEKRRALRDAWLAIARRLPRPTT